MQDLKMGVYNAVIHLEDADENIAGPMGVHNAVMHLKKMQMKLLQVIKMGVRNAVMHLEDADGDITGPKTGSSQCSKF